jgi:hypothetical protein
MAHRHQRVAKREQHQQQRQGEVDLAQYGEPGRVGPRAIRFSENVVADIGEWTSTWGRRALDFGGRVGYHDCNQI